MRTIEAFLGVVVVAGVGFLLPADSRIEEFCCRLICFIAGAGAIAAWNEYKPRKVVCSICFVDGRKAVPICAECIRATSIAARQREREKILGGPEVRS